MRLVLDTNIVISGLLWGGVPRRLLDQARDRRATLFTSSVLLDELADVLSRDKFATMLDSQGITPAFLMQRYGMLARLVTAPVIERTVRDPDDDAVIATAVAAQADAIVSGDDDLLVLKSFQGIPILTAAQAVKRTAGEK
ncbi:MAG: putative toxin-antitoxin system toxin component, PIN family [Gammaproteobacteria bacterium]|nr:putative toxin-antitoxin system toxin component, PIN family [Gammaproteobacteria bacterium]